ncbi:MAG TPA: aldolase/citrate lyase family protein [Polyangiales bacterium]|nr:aldolase/citrate lyase family protein [Polyangiales bacterium]
MSARIHPNDALFAGEKPFPIINTCEHFAGSEKLIEKAMELQQKLEGIFDITMDCEDGAKQGEERKHAEMVVAMAKSAKNVHKKAGVRIHDPSNAWWKQDVDILVPGAGEALAYITLPKPTRVEQVREQITYIQEACKKAGVQREIPIHVLIETHGALRDAYDIAALPWVQVLDFGLMDFVSGFHGAISSECMRSPGQFEHRAIAYAKARVVSAAMASGVIPAHNVTLDLKNTYATYSDASRARNEFGFLRMWSIYPAQIQSIVDAMKPRTDEVENAVNILAAAQDANWGPIQYEGELHDRATYRYFWELVQKAKVTGLKLPETTQRWFT